MTTPPEDRPVGTNDSNEVDIYAQLVGAAVHDRVRLLLTRTHPAATLPKPDVLAEAVVERVLRG